MEIVSRMLASCVYSRRTNSSLEASRANLIDEKSRRIEIKDKGLRSLPSLIIQNRNGLKHLNLDGNLLTENAFNMPIFPRLKSLSLQRNKIRDISRLLEFLRESCPRLESIILLGNPGWPLFQGGFPDERYSLYRMQTESYLRSLRYIDSLPTNRELCDRGIIGDSNRNKRPSIQKDNSEVVENLSFCTDSIRNDNIIQN